MIRRAGLLIILALSAEVYAASDCSGVPSAVKMGEYGSQEAYAIVTIEGVDYRLGLPSEDSTKMRFSIVQSALLADKNIKLRFWSASSCTQAAEERMVPSSVQLIK